MARKNDGIVIIGPFKLDEDNSHHANYWNQIADNLAYEVRCTIPRFTESGKAANTEALDRAFKILCELRQTFNSPAINFANRNWAPLLLKESFGTVYFGDNVELRKRHTEMDGGLTTCDTASFSTTVVAPIEELRAFLLGRGADKLEIQLPQPLTITFLPLTSQAVSNCRYRTGSGKMRGNIAMKIKTNVKDVDGREFAHGEAIPEHISLSVVFNGSGKPDEEATIGANKERHIHEKIVRMALEFIEPEVDKIHRTLKERPLNLSGIGESAVLRMSPCLRLRRKNCITRGVEYIQGVNSKQLADPKVKNIALYDSSIQGHELGVVVWDDDKIWIEGVISSGRIKNLKLLDKKDEFLRNKIINAVKKWSRNPES